MNVVLLEPEEVGADGCTTVHGRRATHVHKILRKQTGDTLRVGQLGGLLGVGEVVTCESDTLALRCTFDAPPLPAPNRTLVLALPRPPVLRRILRHATALGVRHIALIHTGRVEKSYWHSPSLAHNAMREQLILGLEQAIDTMVPDVSLHTQFAPFCRESLPTLLAQRAAFVLQPGAATALPAASAGPVSVVIGPEGGLLPREVAAFEQAGCTPVHAGARILPVETAVSMALGRLLPLA